MKTLLLLLVAATAAAQQDRYGAPAPGSTPAKPAFELRLTALDLALAKTIAEEPSTWRLDRLKREAEDLVKAATTEQQRAEARSAVSRVARFEELSQQLTNPPAAPATRDAGWRSPNLQQNAATTKVAPPVRLTKASPASQHDAEGVLRPVVSKRPNAPKYAVVDTEGRIAALVTPTPETDQRLKQLVGRRVGLEGQRGYRTDLKRDHVVAERVTPLGALRR